MLLFVLIQPLLSLLFPCFIILTYDQVLQFSQKFLRRDCKHGGILRLRVFKDLMAIRSRFRTLLGLEHARKDEENEVVEESNAATAVFKEGEREFENDPLSNEEIISSIEEVYFSEVDSFDASDYELQKLPEVLNINELDTYRNVLRRQAQAVSKSLYMKVLENQTAYMQELQRVIDIQATLEFAKKICDSSRSHLEHSRSETSLGGLTVLAKNRKKQHLVNLLDSLGTIKTLQQTDVRLKEMLQEENYPGAINLCLECEKAARDFKHYKCISELSANLQDILVQIESELDTALAKTCSNFDPLHYEKLQTAYRYLGKVQVSIDQLHLHFMNAINSEAFLVLLKHVEENRPQDLNEGGIQTIPFQELCQKVGVEDFTPCLVDLCKTLWKVMLNYHEVVKWHKQNEYLMEGHGSDETDGQISYNKKYVTQKLNHGLHRIWKEVQERVKCYLLGTDLSYFKYDDFIHVLDLVNRLISIGEEFCGSKSEELHESIRTQTVNYFKNYHRSRLEELRMFLENEVWELCPVKANFSLVILQEFRFLKKIYNSGKGHRRTDSGNIKSEMSELLQSLYFRFNSFDEQKTEDESEDLLSNTGGDVNDNHNEDEDDDYDDDDDDDDIPEELKLDYVDEKTGEHSPRSSSHTKLGKKLSRNHGPVVTNTTLNVLRLFGKYMQMMNVLKPIAFDVVICVSQLFDYYLFAVQRFFCPFIMDESKSYDLSTKLSTSLKRIKENLIVDGYSSSEYSDVSSVDDMKVPAPCLSPLTQLNNAEGLFGLSERIVATESLVFLAKQFESLQPHLESLIPTTKRAFLSQFYSQTVCTAHELRKPIYQAVASRVVDFNMIVHLMSSVKWDIKEIMSEHNSYVDMLLKELQLFSARVSQIGRSVPVPNEVLMVLWDHCSRRVNRSFVDGFSCAKKCTNEGRALMQLDYRQFLVKLEKLTTLRPIPEKDFVEAYIKAYYLTAPDMERWIREHKEYSTKQLTSLVNCGTGSHFSKKEKQRLLNVIEETEKQR
ncbi:syndetin-like [Xenia sp. Carnegie-2017]|uniref:syndetin-like n=1 Tax=Xenia sp. Carnegie-2017 TaxID=2897299 RepID=UPI001F049E41|nr:syndetin-like [Xenia sp. Carnegie-2017]